MADVYAEIDDKKEKTNKDLDTKDQCAEEKSLENTPLKNFMESLKQKYDILVEPNDIAIFV